MKLSLVTLILIAMVYFMRGADGPSEVTYVGHDKVAAALAKSGPLVTAPDLLVIGSHRAGPGRVELHEKETDVFYVVDGAATFVTGGVMVGGRAVSPGQQTGEAIQDGHVHQLTKGDVIVIPAGTPHWFKEVPQSVSYLVVKVLKP